MGLFDHHEEEIRRLLRITEKLEWTIDRQESEIDRLIELLPKRPHKVGLVLLNIKTKSKIMSLSIVSNQAAAGTLGLLDSVTNLPVSGTFAGTAATSDTPAAFTANVDAGGNVNVIGVAAGQGNLNVTTNATFTDSTGAAQTQAVTLTVPVTVTAVVTADAVALTIAFGNPTQQ